MLPVLRQSHLFLFGCLLRAIGGMDVLDIILRMLCRCTYIALTGVESALVLLSCGVFISCRTAQLYSSAALSKYYSCGV